MHLLDHLHPMQEQQLRGIILRPSGILTLLIIELDSQIPKRNSIITGRDSNDTIISRMPLDAGDLLFMKIETGNRGGFRRDVCVGRG